MERFEEVKAYDEIDAKLGFERFESARAEGEERDGWLVNMHQVRLGQYGSLAEALMGSDADGMWD